MEKVIQDIQQLFTASMGFAADSIRKLPPSGSDRIYFRVQSAGTSYIATYGRNVRENQTFVYFSEHFGHCGCPVPRILATNEENTIYLQEDLGVVSLLNKLDELGRTDETLLLFRQALRALAHLQICGDNRLDYSRCITSREFGKGAIMADLLYFKYYFLDTLQLPYDKETLIEEFETLSQTLADTSHRYFMFRDFQSRNVMIREGKVHFIDYQGGMKGALQYDVASLLWQARAELPDNWKNSLLEYYMDCVESELSTTIDRDRFTSQYNGYVLVRLLQVLGAYGFRGLFERKAHFLISIPLALANLKKFVAGNAPDPALKEFNRLLQLLVSGELMDRFKPVQATAETPLLVRINSFSYKKGIPPDTSGNGGGFVFDCRGILNPGRLEEYKKLTGRDIPVSDFLEQRTRMTDFMNSVYSLIDIAVEDYIKRGFHSLQVSFGCTGGQHRSVFAADSLTRHLKNKFKVKVETVHIEQESKNWINN